MPIFIVFLALLLITLAFFYILSSQEKEKNELFHVMAHRFRSPISIIKWYTELLTDKSVGNLNDKQKEYFQEIYSATERLNETIDSLAILLQLQSNNLVLTTEKININNLIAQVLLKLQFKIQRHKLHLREVYLQNKDVFIDVDQRLLNIIIQSLLENSIKYTPENGNINIKVNALNNRVFIKIQDSGYRNQEKKSAMLSSSVNSRDAGFNLMLVKLILKKMQGHIDYKSEEKKGTIFSISLPS